MVYSTSRFCHKCRNETQTTIANLKDDTEFQYHRFFIFHQKFSIHDY